MFFKRLAQQMRSCVANIIRKVEERFKQWTKPGTEALVEGTLADVTRRKGELIAENALLRQQVIILQRQVKRPQLTPRDLGILVLLARWTRRWKDALAIVKPDTLLGWHRQGFRLYWRHKSRTTKREPQIAQETIDLIRQMAAKIGQARNGSGGTEEGGYSRQQANGAALHAPGSSYLRQSGQTGLPFLKICQSIGRVTSCRSTICFFDRCSCFSSSNWALGAWFMSG
jgi:hypothetical protein